MFKKHLGLFLDEKLNFNHLVNEKLAKATNGINVIRKLSNFLPRHSLVTIYKSFVRPHLDYGDMTMRHESMTNLTVTYFTRELKVCSIMLLLQ